MNETPGQLPEELAGRHATALQEWSDGLTGPLGGIHHNLHDALAVDGHVEVSLDHDAGSVADKVRRRASGEGRVRRGQVGGIEIPLELLLELPPPAGLLANRGSLFEEGEPH